MASAKFKGNRCKIDGEIAENHAIQLIIFNLSGIMSFRTNTCWRFVLPLILATRQWYYEATSWQPFVRPDPWLSLLSSASKVVSLQFDALPCLPM